MSLTTRQRGAYTRGPYIRVEKCVTNLGCLYSGELIHGGGGGLLTEFYGNRTVSCKHHTGTILVQIK